ncbi:MAG: acyl-CoA/acyl-ACP dehydrogenase [Candidatus Tectomicrobia bacterium]|uniref:Acyl-CoA/acyl-ACP dehydrogenase n=1 Tax=Tectimicrobiota bacterium TaxID=2528274 RepID=A0A933LQV6_UNCTE|nr:acyl-CoA/acyl-ACP dehydrogenase [Candidatus Tectomicrobia bacterium]
MAMEEKEFKQFKGKAFKFLWDEVAPLEDEIENTGHFPRERFWRKFADLGMLGLNISKEYGGAGLSERQSLDFEKEWSKVHGGLRVILHVHAGGNDNFLLAGEEQKRYYWPKLAKGELSCAFGLTEPDGGSGKDTKTRGRREGNNYILNGRKHLITNADFADLFNVICWTEMKSGEYQISNLLVERNRPGLTIRDMKHCMGCAGAYHGRLNFKDCAVPVTNVLGEEGKGLEPSIHMLNVSRVRIAANALGTMERCLDLAIEFAKQRVTFNKPIADRQAIQRYLAEMAQDIYALQCTIDDAGRKIDENRDIYLEANLCKMLAIEGTRRVTDNALLVFGGIGYTHEYPVERLYRDARLNWLEEGTPTIHYLVAARYLLDGGRTYRRFHDEVIENPIERQKRLS